MAHPEFEPLPGTILTSASTTLQLLYSEPKPKDMSVEESTLERLAYIKNLHQVALELSRRPSPFKSTALLAFHDAAEMFLILALNNVDGRNEEGFMAYWWEIEKASDIKISQKESMRDLHDARNDLKHDFRRPSRADLESYRATVNRFFEENVPRVFDIDYSQIDILYLVEFDRTREHLSSAKEKVNEDQTRAAALALQDAFSDLMMEYEDRALNQLGYTPYPKLSTSEQPNSRQEDTDQLVRDTSNIFSKIFQALKILALGINYQDYEHFQHVISNAKNMNATDKDFDDADLEFAIRFVAETALTLQNRPMDLEKEYQHPRTGSVFDY